MRRILLLALAPAVLSACGDDGPAGPDVSPPTLQSITPAYGTAGTEVRIDGTGFDAESVAVYFGALASPLVEREGGALYAIAPQGLTAGTMYAVRVANQGSAADTLDNAFEAVEPIALRVNGVTRPTGLTGMTIIVEGDAFGDVPDVGGGKVYFLGAGGTPIQAAIVDSAADWTNTFIVTTVPQGVPDTTGIWVETATGVSDTIQFRLIQSGLFSPSTINWTTTMALPQPLQALGAAFVPIENGATPGNYIFTIGGADSTGAATGVVYRTMVQESGVLEAWATDPTPLPDARAFHTTVAATPYTAALDTTTTAAVLYAIGGRDSAGDPLTSVVYATIDLAGTVGAWQDATALPAPLHSAGAAVFRGYLYLAGGASTDGAAVAAAYRAKVAADGSLGAWEPVGSLTTPRAYFAMVGFGPYLYAVGGETGTSTPGLTTMTGTETGAVDLARINLRDGSLIGDAWTAVTALGKARSKHSALFAGGAIFTTSGIYSGQPGSSENTYASINSDGSLASWNGATGAETIAAEIGISLFNQATVTFIDSAGNGHVLVLGGASRADGAASAEVVYY